MDTVLLVMTLETGRKCSVDNSSDKPSAQEAELFPLLEKVAELQKFKFSFSS